MSFYIGVFTYAGIYGILAMSFTLVHGTGGMFTIAHAAFFGLGAYGSALLSRVLDPEMMLVAVMFGSLLAGAASMLIGLVALRERGQYLMLVTFSVQILFGVALLNLPFTGGDNGLGELTPLRLGPWRVDEPWLALWTVWALVLIVYLALRRVEQSDYGLVLRAAREDEYVVEAFGGDVYRAKLIAFATSGMLAGFAGAIFAHYSSYINPASFSFEVAILIVTISVLGGQYSYLGAIVGAMLVIWLPHLIAMTGIEGAQVAAITQLINAGVIIAVLYLRPSGIVPESVPNAIRPTFRLGASTARQAG